MHEARRLGLEIEEAVRLTGTPGRVCGERCTAPCPRCGTTNCQCTCSTDCADAPLALSGEPEHQPIEPAIMPLVFQMKRLGLFQPCWSCEGHLRTDGSLWEPPKVRFTCESTVHLRLLSSGLGALAGEGQLAAPWRVVVTDSDPTDPRTTFSLEPDASRAEGVALAELQEDVAEIARSLQDMMAAQAQALLGKVGRVLSGSTYALG